LPGGEVPPGCSSFALRRRHHAADRDLVCDGVVNVLAGSGLIFWQARWVREIEATVPPLTAGV
jgi:hypothetical protein